MVPNERTGVIFHEGLAAEQMLNLARQADERNFDGIFLSEEAGHNSLVLLGAMASVSRRARIGSCIASIYTRSAPIYAMGINTINDLSGGRAILGLGTSPPYFVKHWHNTPWERPVSRIKDYIKIVRATLTGEKVSYQGRASSCRDFQLAVNPPRNRIPLYVGAIGPQMVTAAGEVADGVMLAPMLSEEYLEYSIQNLKRGAEKAGRDYREIDVAAPIITSVDPDERKALDRARVYLTYFAVVFYYEFLLDMSGFHDLGKKLRRVNKEKGYLAATELVSDDMARKLTIAGTPEQCKTRLAQLRAAGFRFAILNPPGPRRVFNQPVQVPVDPWETYSAVLKYLAPNEASG